MVKLASLFYKIKAKRILVAGDFMLDAYIFGKAKRISPEAPVPVLLVDHEEERAGGAGNVVLNLLSLGMQVSALGRLGDDAAGIAVKQLLAAEGVNTNALFFQKKTTTSKKTRVIAGAQHMVRIDCEKQIIPDADLEKTIIRCIPELIMGHDLVAISDYAKGFLTDNIIGALIHAARAAKIPVIVDPKGSDFAKYSGASIIKPNLSEAFAAAGKTSSQPLEEAAQEIFKKVKTDVLMVTRSEEGISLYFPDGSYEDHPVQAKEIRDVTGAGDTVLAMISAALANDLSVSEATDLANVAGAVAVEHVGCARVTLQEIARRCIDLHAGVKVFDEAHSALLEKALALQDCIHLNLPPRTQTSVELLRAIRELAKDRSKELVVSLEESAADDDLVHVLSSLKEVSYIHRGQLPKSVQCSQTFQFVNAELYQL